MIEGEIPLYLQASGQFEWIFRNRNRIHKTEVVRHEKSKGCPTRSIAYANLSMNNLRRLISVLLFCLALYAKSPV